MCTKRLRITADDLGADVWRNKGIFQALEADSITATSLLINGHASKQAIAYFHAHPHLQPSLGLHVNLSEGGALLKTHRYLTNAQGEFHGKWPALKLLQENTSTRLKKEIRDELFAQIDTLKETGLPINHLDGHHHVHLFPGAIDATLQAVQSYSIPYVRLTNEPPLPLSATRLARMTPEQKQQCEKEIALFRAIAVSSSPLFKHHAIHSSDHFFGLCLKGFSLPCLLETLASLPDGYSELMVHPGVSPIDTDLLDESMSEGLPEIDSPFSGFLNTDRAQELTALLSTEMQTTLAHHGIELTPARDRHYCSASRTHQLP